MVVSASLDTRRLDWLERESSYHSVTTLELDIERITAPPRVDGIFVCYDSGDASSFAPVPDFLRMSTLPLRL